MDFSRQVLAIAAIVYVLAGAYTIYATYSLSLQAGDYVDYYYWYTRINIVLMSFSAFILLKGIGERITHERAGLWFRRFAEASFGIYLIHAMVLIYLKRAGINAFSGPAIISVPAVSILGLLISWGMVAILQRIPMIREIAPS
jgi:surface polysaccharide O-acyltransferase-like enzyme